MIVIIGLLAGVVTLSTHHFIDKARQNRARTDISTYKSHWMRSTPTPADSDQ